jgi:FAD/FMN-containing dehydrogenase
MIETSQIVNELAGVVGEKLINYDADKIAQYTVDEIIPKAVVFPKNTQQVSDVVKYANEKNLAIVPMGSGSKISMGNPPKRLDLVICTTRMNHMRDVDVANLTLTVEAGVKFLDIQARLATEEDRCYLPLEDLTTESGEMICSDRSHSGCFLPIDAPFSYSATIGGIIACNSSGPRRLLYNLPRDIILGSRFVAANGDIIGTGGKTVKNVSGYDLSKLMVGAAGSLGILCEMTLRLLPLPEQMETLLFSFKDFADAAAFSNQIHETSLLPAAVEIMNGKAFENLKIENIPKFKPDAYVSAVALEAFTEAVDRMRTEIKKIAIQANRTSEAGLAEDEHPPFWLRVSDLVSTVSHQCDELLSAQLIYPTSVWKDIIEYANGALSEKKLDHTLLAHTGSGVCLINFILKGDGTKEKVVDVIQKLLEQCRGSGGNLVVQKAPAEMKKDLPIWGKPGSDSILMKRIKEALDPKGIMSPGRYIENL